MINMLNEIGQMQLALVASQKLIAALVRQPAHPLRRLLD
jgi:hypothetical protein